MTTLVGPAYPSITGPTLPTKRWHRHRSLDDAASSDPGAMIGFHSCRKRCTKLTNEETAPAFSVCAGKARNMGPI